MSLGPQLRSQTVRSQTESLLTGSLAAARVPRIATLRGTRKTMLIFGLAAMLPLQGCASSIGSSFGGWFSTAKKEENPDPPEKIYADADTLMTKGKYSDAAAKFEDVDRHHPYAPQARRALVMQAYSLYKEGKYQDAIVAARRYTTMHPGTKEAALAQHIIASSYFDEISDPARDQTSTKKALQELKILVQRYPDSEYAQKAHNRIRLATDTLAAAEMNVGRYYLKERNHLAAINRFKVVVSEYQTTAHVEEALARLTESYMALGIRQEAQTAAAVLGHNFPSSRWYKDSYALLAADGLKPAQDNSSWISKAWKTTVGKVTSAE
jgi:outer membrane protein assembly factor BamD